MQDQHTHEYSLIQHIEAILFWKGDPISVSQLAKITKAESEEVKKALQELRGVLKHRGIVLIEHDGEFTLGTNPESARLIEAVRTEELSKELGKAALETLAIVLYQGPIRRSEIDYIRGVNSNFILRNLLIRGLIERKTDQKDTRAAVYSPSLDLLRFLGISQVSDLPDFDTVKESITQFKQAEQSDSDIPSPSQSPEAPTKEAADESAQEDTEPTTQTHSE